MNTFKEILERLVKEFIGLSKRYPAGQELEDIAKKAQQMFDQQRITVVDERKLPKAEIKALPLKDKEKAEAAVKKKIEAQNIQAQQSLKGGESSGAQRGRPELVDESYGQTVYMDKSEMMMIMDDAAKKFDQARDAVARGDYDEARAILRYEIEDNYKLPQETRNAAYDARVFIRRGEGIDPEELGYGTKEEAIEALDDQISKGMKTTYEDNWPMYTDPEDKSKMKNIEYVNFLDEPGEDFGTPNSIMQTPSDIDYEYATGGRVGFARGGGIINILNQLLKSKKMGAEEVAQLIDLVNQAKKAGIPINTLKDLENFKSQIEEASGKIYESRKKYPGVPKGTKSGLPSVLLGEAPKTNLKKIRQKVYKDRQSLLELAKNEQIPVKKIDDLLSGKIKKVKRSAGRGTIEIDDEGVPYVTETFSDKMGNAWIKAEKARLEGLIKVLQTPMLRNDRIDDLRVLEKVEELGGDQAMYDDLRMRKYKNLPSKSEYRFDPEAAEQKAEKTMSKTQKEIDQLLGIDEPDDDVGMFDDVFNKMFKDFEETRPLPGEEPLKNKKTKRRLNAKGGLNSLIGN